MGEKAVGQTFRASAEFWDEAKAEAARRGLSLQDWGRMLMAVALRGEAVLFVQAPKAAPVQEIPTTRPAQPPATVPAEKLAVARDALKVAEVRAASETPPHPGFGPVRSEPGSRLKRSRK